MFYFALSISLWFVKIACTSRREFNACVQFPTLDVYIFNLFYIFRTVHTFYSVHSSAVSSPSVYSLSDSSKCHLQWPCMRDETIEPFGGRGKRITDFKLDVDGPFDMLPTPPLIGVIIWLMYTGCSMHNENHVSQRVYTKTPM